MTIMFNFKFEPRFSFNKMKLMKKIYRLRFTFVLFSIIGSDRLGIFASVGWKILLLPFIDREFSLRTTFCYLSLIVLETWSIKTAIISGEFSTLLFAIENGRRRNCRTIWLFLWKHSFDTNNSIFFDEW